MKYNVKQIKEVYLKKGYKFFENGDFNLNLIAIRNKNVFTNQFDDDFLIVYKELGVWKIFQIEWTTVAGTLGKGGALNPLSGTETGTGVSGTAVILEGQYLKAFKWVENDWIYPFVKYFKQIGNLKYVRDNNRDFKIDTNTRIYIGNYKTHLHAMSPKGVLSKFVNYYFSAWSQGCMGAPEPSFKNIEPIVKKAIAIWGNSFSLTVLNKNDFL